MPPVNAAWCCRHVSNFRYADEMRRVVASSVRVSIVQDDGLRLEAAAVDIEQPGQAVAATVTGSVQLATES
jgi:hypothetical protein